VSDLADDRLVPHLPASVARLAETLAQPKRIAIGCVLALTALAWLSIALMTTNASSWQALCLPSAGAGPSELALALPMWAAMTLAMMLPTAAPMIVTYAEIADTAARKGEPVVSPIVLTAGYVAVWLGFSVAGALAQWMLAREGLLEGGGSIGRLAGGAVFIAAGLYQFSALKQSCLKKCQRPFPFFFLNWTTERPGVFSLGLRQGLFCLGCCFAMMLLMFAVGAMNVAWMAGLGVLMALEKLSATPRLSVALGWVFAISGSLMIAWSLS
jgi:predicted metal-binding membrane protein